VSGGPQALNHASPQSLRCGLSAPLGCSAVLSAVKGSNQLMLYLLTPESSKSAPESFVIIDVGVQPEVIVL
jgi:hypothetical protein